MKIFELLCQDRKYASPTVSIAMATYNGEKYLREQLDSLATQMALPIELVVTDDGSTDNTLEILKEFASSAPFAVKIFQNDKRLGYAENFLKAASLCTADLIAFCDQDDRWDCRKISVCAKEFLVRDVSLCAHSGLVWTGNGESVFRLPNVETRRLLLAKSVNPMAGFHGFAIVTRRSVFNVLGHEFRPLDICNYPSVKQMMSHDDWAWFISAIFGKIVMIPDALVYYRQHEQNVFGAQKSPNSLEKLRSTVDQVNYLQQAMYFEELRTFLVQLAQRCPNELSEPAKTWADNFERKAKLLRHRSAIYENKPTFDARLKAFFLIMRSFGYFPDKKNIRLKPRSAIKDFFYGVTGAYRFRYDERHF